MTPVFVTGMFRSGTTLVARMLQCHRELAFASDPLARLFKEFRNAIARREGLAVDPAAPWDDYYFDDEKQALFHAVQSASLDLDLEGVDLVRLRADMARASQPYSPLLAPLLGDLKGESFRDLLASSLTLIQRAYGKPQARGVGFKEVWLGELVPHVLNAFPNARAVHVVRDPRAISASKNATPAKYPWLFLSRQWRKLATLAKAHAETEGPWRGRVRVITYEELVQQPRKTIESLCAFLHIDMDERLLDPANFRDGSGGAWVQNTSFGTGKTAFDAQAVRTWEDKLRPEQVRLIEYLCRHEMPWFGYEPAQPAADHVGWLFAQREVDPADLAEWIRPFTRLAPADVAREMALEHLRHEALAGRLGPLGDADAARFGLVPALARAAA